MKKRILGILLVCTVAMGLLAGCGAKKDQTSANNEINHATEPSNATEGSDLNTNKEAKGKVLVVYYSATGHTQAVANAVAEETGGDTFELVPVQPYSDADLDWTNNKSRVSVEHDQEAQRDVALTSTTVADWDSYDTVFIGYPIWWGIVAWPVNNFISENDFSGKMVIPFCTSTSSGIGESGELLEKLAGNGSWQEGERFQSSASAESVKKWVQGLTY